MKFQVEAIGKAGSSHSDVRDVGDVPGCRPCCVVHRSHGVCGAARNAAAG